MSAMDLPGQQRDTAASYDEAPQPLVRRPPPSAIVETVQEAQFRYSPQLAVLSGPGSARAESIGALRTHLLTQHVRDRRRSLTVCGPSAGVGCTYVATNLAVAMSMAGLKTLLIDGNLRAPAVQDLIQPIAPGPGLVQCLGDGSVPLGDAICEHVLPNLSILFAGGASPVNAQELLAGPRFQALIETCMRDFDLTIVDTPPSNSCADARRIANVLRYALIVARRDMSYVADVRLLADELQADRAMVVGTFLNDI